MEPTSVQFNPPINSIPQISDGTLMVFYLVTAIYIIFTAILYYHWKQYSTDAKVGWITGVVYLCTTLPLVIIMGVLALAI